MGDAKYLIVGNPVAAATGIFHFIQADESKVHDELKRGPECVFDEWQRGFENGHITEEDRENLNYVLMGHAGSSDQAFQYGWKRDRAEDGSVLSERSQGGAARDHAYGELWLSDHQLQC